MVLINSLAIGKKGQNVRLAAKLIGWKIDIKSEEEKRQEVEQAMSDVMTQTATPLDQLLDIGDGVIEKLQEAGVTTIEGLADMTPEQLEAIPGIGPKTVEKISLAVSNYFAAVVAVEEAVVEPEAEVLPEAVKVDPAEIAEPEPEDAPSSPATEAEPEQPDVQAAHPAESEDSVDPPTGESEEHSS